MKKLLIIILIITMMPVIALAENPSGGEMMFDIVVLRPVGIVASVVGAVIFVISAPFSALAGNIDTAGKMLVNDPVEYTFKRPLGEF